MHLTKATQWNEGNKSYIAEWMIQKNSPTHCESCIAPRKNKEKKSYKRLNRPEGMLTCMASSDWPWLFYMRSHFTLLQIKSRTISVVHWNKHLTVPVMPLQPVLPHLLTAVFLFFQLRSGEKVQWENSSHTFSGVRYLIFNF